MLRVNEFYEVIPNCVSRGQLRIEKYFNASQPAGAFNAVNAVCIFGEILRSVKGNLLTSKWYAEKVDGYAPGSLIGSSAIDIEADGSYDVSFCFQPPHGGWSPGSYRVEVYFNGALQADHTFSMA